MTEKLPLRTLRSHWKVMLREIILALIIYSIMTGISKVMMNEWGINTYIYFGDDGGFRLFVCIALYVFLIRLTASLEKQYVNFGAAVQLKVKFLRVIRYATHFFMVLYVLNILGYPLNQIISLMAIGGVGSIAVTFAAQDVIKNLFGGLAVFFDRPFKTGDFVVFPKLGIEGRVMNISWRSTKIQTLNNTIKTVQNNAFLTDVVESMPGKKTFIMDWIMHIDFSERKRLTAVKNELIDFLNAHDSLGMKPAEVHVRSLTPKGIQLQFMVHIRKQDFEKMSAIQDELLVGCVSVLDRLTVKWLDQ